MVSGKATLMPEVRGEWSTTAAHSNLDARSTVGTVPILCPYRMMFSGLMPYLTHTYRDRELSKQIQREPKQAYLFFQYALTVSNRNYTSDYIAGFELATFGIKCRCLRPSAIPFLNAQAKPT